MKNNINKFLFLKKRSNLGKSFKANPAFRKLFSNYIKKRKTKKEIQHKQNNEGYGSIQGIKFDLERVKNYIDNLHNQKTKLKKTLKCLICSEKESNFAQVRSRTIDNRTLKPKLAKKPFYNTENS